jgi:hypothetical protein
VDNSDLSALIQLLGRWSSSMETSLPRIRVAWLLLAVLVTNTAMPGEFAERSAKITPVPDHQLYQQDEQEWVIDDMFYDACDACGSYGSPCCVGPVGANLGSWRVSDVVVQGMETEPLVTAGPTGTLSDPRTFVLFGDDDLLGQVRSGFRVRLGTWLDCSQRWALEGEYWRLGGVSEDFFAASDAAGNPAIYRPFSMSILGIEPGSSIHRPGMTSNWWRHREYWPAVFRCRHPVSFRGRACGCGTTCVALHPPLSIAILVSTHPTDPFGRRFDFLIGYRYLRLSDQLTIREDLNSLRTPFGTFDLTDSFAASNDFHGAELGLLSEFDYGRWSLELLGRLALGGVRQQVSIAGQTIIDTTPHAGGLLAQQTNSGTRSRNEFAVLPQLGATVGYRLTPRLQATVGYSFLYLSRVVRASEQIDLDVNPDLLAPQQDPLTGALRPRFQFRDTDFWAQGMNFGLHFAW